MRIKLSNTSIFYNGKTRKPSEEFEITEADGSYLVEKGLAVELTISRKPSYVPADEVDKDAEDKDIEDALKPAPKSKK